MGFEGGGVVVVVLGGGVGGGGLLVRDILFEEGLLRGYIWAHELDV